MLEFIRELLNQAYTDTFNNGVDYALVRQAGELLADITPQLREAGRLELHPWYDVKRNEG